MAIEEVKVVETAPTSASGTPPGTPEVAAQTSEPPTADRPGIKRRTRHASSHADRPRPLPPEVGPVDPESKGKITEKFGPQVGRLIVDAAEGRHGPFTRPLRIDPVAAAEAVVPPQAEETTGQQETTDPGRVTGKSWDKGPVHYLPRPIAYNMEPDHFFKYWASLTQEELDRVKIYVYRLWPVTDVNLQLPAMEQGKLLQGKRKPLSKCLPPGTLKQPWDWKNWKAEIYHRYGAGDYSFSLNDTHPAVNRRICQTAIVEILRDMDTYPPVIQPIKILVIHDPANQSYVRWRQTNGLKTPGVDGEDSTGGEGGEVSEALKVVDRVLAATMPEGGGRRQSTSDAVTEAVKSTTAVITAAATASQKMLTDAMERNTKQSDPLEIHKLVMDTAKVIGGGDGKNASFESTLKMMIDSQKAQTDLLVKMLEGQNKALEMRLASVESQALARIEAAEKQAGEFRTMWMQLLTKQTAPPPTPDQQHGISDQMKTMFGLLDGVVKLTDRFSDLRGGGKSSSGNPIMDAISSLITEAPNMMYNFALARSAAAPAGATALQPVPPASATTDEEDDTQPEQPSQEEVAKRFLDSIEIPIINALANGVDGAVFAAQLIQSNGQQTYDFIAGQDDNAIVQFLKNNGNILRVMQTNPNRFMEFINQFRDRNRAAQFYQQIVTMQAGARTQPPPAQAQPDQPPANPTVVTEPRTRHRPGTRTVIKNGRPVVVDIPPDTPQSPGPAAESPTPQPATA